MPVIKPYQQRTAADGALRVRQASGTDFGGPGLQNLGQGIISAGMDVSRASYVMNQGLAQRAATDAAIFVSELRTSTANDLDVDALAWKPGMDRLPGVTLGKLQGALDKGAEKFSQTALGQDTYRKAAAGAVAYFAEISGNMQAKLDGQAAVLQMENYVNTQGVHLQTHPASTPIVLDDMEQILGSPQGIYANIGAIAQQKLVHEAQEKVAVSGVQGLIRTTPLRAEQILTDPNLATDETYGWITKHVPQEKLATLIDHARVMGALEVQKRDLAVAALAKAEDTEQKATLGQVTVNWIKDQASPDYNPAKTMRDTIEFLQQHQDAVAKHPEMVRAALSAIQSDINERKQGGETPGDPLLYRQLFTKIAEGRMPDLTELNRARGNGQLPASWHQELVKEWEMAKTPDGRSLQVEISELVKRSQQFIAPQSLTGVLKDPAADLNVLRFQRDIQEKVGQLRKEGKDPHVLFDPKSPEYLGEPDKIMGKYVLPFTEQITNMAKQLRPAPGAPKGNDGGVVPDNQRKPGESIAEFRRRTEKP